MNAFGRAGNTVCGLDAERIGAPAIVKSADPASVTSLFDAREPTDVSLVCSASFELVVLSTFERYHIIAGSTSEIEEIAGTTLSAAIESFREDFEHLFDENPILRLQYIGFPQLYSEAIKTSR